MKQRSVKILDGGMGRELKRLGAPFKQPEWSALALMEGPHFVRQAHDSFVNAGAEIITTNSYAICPFHIGQDRFDKGSVELSRLASELARDCADAFAPSRRVTVAGSLPPALGSYRPDLFDHEKSVQIHKKIIEGMDGKVDVWLAETQSSIAEIRAAKEALGTNSKPLWISFTLDDEPQGGGELVTLRSGESVEDAVKEALALGAGAILFNCSQPEVMEFAVKTSKRIIGDDNSDVDIGVYANAFPPQSKKATANATLLDIRSDMDPLNYTSWARRWVDAGATIIGGCCGITPQHIYQLKVHFDQTCEECK